MFESPSFSINIAGIIQKWPHKKKKKKREKSRAIERFLLVHTYSSDHIAQELKQTTKHQLNYGNQIDIEGINYVIMLLILLFNL